MKKLSWKRWCFTPTSHYSRSVGSPFALQVLLLPLLVGCNVGFSSGTSGSGGSSLPVYEPPASGGASNVGGYGPGGRSFAGEPLDAGTAGAVGIGGRGLTVRPPVLDAGLPRILPPLPNVDAGTIPSVDAGDVSPLPLCTNADECPSESCDGAVYVPASSCALGRCVTPESVDCGTAECRPGGCHTISFALGEPVDTETRGDITDGVLSHETCPRGGVLIGFDAVLNQGFIGQLKLVCGLPALAPQDPYTIEIHPSSELGVHGGATGTTIQSRCPENQGVVGFQGRSGIALDQLSLTCGPLERQGDLLDLGFVQAIEPVGGTGGSLFPLASCPNGGVAIGGNIVENIWIRGFGLVCADITLEWQTL